MDFPADTVYNMLEDNQGTKFSEAGVHLRTAAGIFERLYKVSLHITSIMPPPLRPDSFETGSYVCPLQLSNPPLPPPAVSDELFRSRCFVLGNGERWWSVCPVVNHI